MSARSLGALAREAGLKRGEAHRAVCALLRGVGWQWIERRQREVAGFERIDRLTREGERGHGRTRKAGRWLELSPNDATQELLGDGEHDGCGHIVVTPPASQGRAPAEVWLRRQIVADGLPWTFEELKAAAQVTGKPTAETRARKDALARILARAARDDSPKPLPSKPRTQRGKMQQQAHPNSVLRRSGLDVQAVERRREAFDRYGRRPVPKGFFGVDEAARHGKNAGQRVRKPRLPGQGGLADALGCSERTIRRLQQRGRELELSDQPAQVVKAPVAVAPTPQGGTVATLSPDQHKYQRPLYTSPINVPPDNVIDLDARRIEKWLARVEQLLDVLATQMLLASGSPRLAAGAVFGLIASATQVKEEAA